MYALHRGTMKGLGPGPTFPSFLTPPSRAIPPRGSRPPHTPLHPPRAADDASSLSSPSSSPSPPPPPPSNPYEAVQAALATANAAALDAQTTLQDPTTLPSAAVNPASLFPAELLEGKSIRSPPNGSRITSVAIAVLLTGAVFGTPALPLLPRALVAGATAGAVAIHGLTSRKLTLSGALAAMVCGGLTLTASARSAALLFGFYLASSALTKLAAARKERVGEEYTKSARDAWQVLANAGVPTLLAVGMGVTSGWVPDATIWGLDVSTRRLLGGVLGYFACCCGDTWASEVGVLSKATPRLITTGRPVRPGTNGGVTGLGMAMSWLGGLFVGGLYALCSWGLGLRTTGVAVAVGGGGSTAHAVGIVAVTKMIISSSLWMQVTLMGGVAGLMGSMLDSLLGATVQYSGYDRDTGKITSKYRSGLVDIAGIPILSNNMVNVVSACATAALTAWYCGRCC